jgi:hypothetical protein
MRTFSAITLLVLVLAGCGRGEEPTAASGTETPATGAPTVEPTEPTEATEPSETEDTEAPGSADDSDTADDAPAATAQHFDTEDVATADFPSGSGEVALLADVRTGVHEGFDRIVLEFEGDEPPSYRVRYIDPPVREDGSGNEVEVEGSAFIEMHLAPAAGVDLSGDGEEFEQTYTGPTRLSPGGEVVRELVRTGDFEANLTWVAGVDGRGGFDVTVLTSPLRLVVDVAHP